MSQADYTDEETKAMEAASASGGGFLDAIGKTDLATMTESEWDEFITSVIQGYCDFFDPEKAKYDAITEDEIPY